MPSTRKDVSLKLPLDHVILFRPSYYGMVIRLFVKTPGVAVGLTRIHKLENTMAANKGSLSDGATTPHCTHPSKLVIELRVIDITFKPKDIMGRVSTFSRLELY
jgi:hypothetical protein